MACSVTTENPVHEFRLSVRGRYHGQKTYVKTKFAPWLNYYGDMSGWAKNVLTLFATYVTKTDNYGALIRYCSNSQYLPTRYGRQIGKGRRLQEGTRQEDPHGS